MAHVLCIYICSLSRNKKSSRVFQNNMVSEPMAIRAEAAAERDGGERGVLLAALAPPLRDAKEERAALGVRLAAAREALGRAEAEAAREAWARDEPERRRREAARKIELLES